MSAMLTTDLKTHWPTIRPILTIRNEREYDRAVKLLNGRLWTRSARMNAIPCS